MLVQSCQWHLRSSEQFGPLQVSSCAFRTISTVGCVFAKYTVATWSAPNESCQVYWADCSLPVLRILLKTMWIQNDSNVTVSIDFDFHQCLIFQVQHLWHLATQKPGTWFAYGLHMRIKIFSGQRRAIRCQLRLSSLAARANSRVQVGGGVLGLLCHDDYHFVLCLLVIVTIIVTIIIIIIIILIIIIHRSHHLSSHRLKAFSLFWKTVQPTDYSVIC